MNDANTPEWHGHPAREFEKAQHDLHGQDARATPHRRRPRYSGKFPRRFEDKYKEHRQDPETLAKVLASGKTPAGTHRSIMVAEVLDVLKPQPGEVAVDCTLGYGGHAREILARIKPGGRLIGLDVDSIELPKTEARLRTLGYGPDVFVAQRSNFAGLPKILAAEKLETRSGTGVSPVRLTTYTEETNETPVPLFHQDPLTGADMILADLGVSSMQLDDPSRGFSVKFAGPLDMRMNPQRGQPVAALLERTDAATLAKFFLENADEPRAELLAAALAGQKIATTTALADAVRRALPRAILDEEREDSIRRVFQALRIAVNEEFSALDTFLRNLPACLNPGGRVAVLTFHSGEDRRVKKSFEAGLRDGVYADIAQEVIRATPAERHDNPRSSSAKLRWAIRSCA